jgi:hypothetical protein
LTDFRPIRYDLASSGCQVAEPASHTGLECLQPLLVWQVVHVAEWLQVKRHVGRGAGDLNDVPSKRVGDAGFLEHVRVLA